MSHVVLQIYSMYASLILNDASKSLYYSFFSLLPWPRSSLVLPIVNVKFFGNGLQKIEMKEITHKHSSPNKIHKLSGLQKSTLLIIYTADSSVVALILGTGI